MDVEAVKKFCAQLPGASCQQYDAPSNVLVYYVKGRKFAYFKTSEPERWRFSVRTSPELFLSLTDVPGIKPARYMARFHWVTIIQVEQLQDAYLQSLILWSFEKASAVRARRKI